MDASEVEPQVVFWKNFWKESPSGVEENTYKLVPHQPWSDF
ncbi:hypothetical protein [Bacillus sp. TH13]|nr:hypothetical protein [Bacillus sp. TH13]